MIDFEAGWTIALRNLYLNFILPFALQFLQSPQHDGWINNQRRPVIAWFGSLEFAVDGDRLKVRTHRTVCDSLGRLLKWKEVELYEAAWTPQSHVLSHHRHLRNGDKNHDVAIFIYGFRVVYSKACPRQREWQISHVGSTSSSCGYTTDQPCVGVHAVAMLLYPSQPSYSLSRIIDPHPIDPEFSPLRALVLWFASYFSPDVLSFKH